MISSGKRWDVLVYLIRRYHLKMGVEVGVKSGRNIQRILNRCPSFIFYGIDPWKPTDAYRHWHEIQIIKNEREARQVEKRFKDRCKLIKNFSILASKLFEDQSIDLVFIDAEHTYDAVRQDIECWLPKIRNKGIIAGHDYRNTNVWYNKGYDFSGVEKAVDEILGDRVKTAPDHVWWMRV